VLFVPGMAIMDEPSAAAIRGFVQRGGTVVMTSYSAVLDEHHQVFHTTLPGRLSDVFGIRVANFEETEWMNERSRDGWQGQRLRVAYSQHEYICDSPRFDVIEPKDADVLCRIVSLEHDYPIVTSHRYGAGRAIYIGLPARDALLDPLINDLIAECGLDTGPAAPAGVMARQIDATHRLYLNLEGTTKKIDIPGAAHSILRDADYRDRFELRPFEPDFIEQK
jgi:beta-galactosidase